MNFTQKIRNAIMTLLNSGLTPHKLALTVALGVWLGVLPVLWGTTLLCAGAAFLFRLNQGYIQIVNYLSYPLQIALLVPFYRLGAWLLPPARFSAGEGGGVARHLGQIGASTVRAVAGWLVATPGLALLLYLILVPLLRRRLARRQYGGCPSPSP